MPKDGKFGTFAGVYVPSLLTILGVIMYLRLPWMVGQAGLYVALGIVLAAHVVSVATGLSVSSIATDKKVGAGGPYYIISRSFGLPIGGAIGLALFVGLSFSVSLYIVGFSSSFLSAIGYEPTADAIRLCGSVTLVAITAITFISTSLAIKSQYLILVLVAFSIVVVFLGKSTSTTVHLTAHEGSPSFGVLFGIFFPAVTGFMAGVNMSGDLRDPKGAIPKGTMLAIATGFAIYAGLVIYLAFTTDPALLRDDPEVLQHTALWGPGVLAGIWGATLSSALGSILGAPRILQAMSVDRITPRAFAKGVGPTKEPRNALVVAFVIAEAGILIAELDLIARVVSMVFLAMYGSINVTCAIESWASPDFRPRFRIPKLVSIIGAVSALLLMIQLDILAMLGATAIMVGLFAYLQRRQLTLEAGDTWEGIWATIVRAGLHRLHKKAGQQRNWRPNVLLFDEADHPRHPGIRAFASSLAAGNGMVTDFALVRPDADRDDDDKVEAAPAAAAEKMGVFDAKIVTDSPFEAIASIAQHHGFSGLPPNTLLLPWHLQTSDPDAFLRVLNTAASRDLNILCLDEPRDVRSQRRRIDMWWAGEAGNFALGVALARFITRAPEWERAHLEVLIVGSGDEDNDALRAKAVRYLEAQRVEATVRIVYRPKGEDLHDLVCNESRTADLVLFGLPDDLGVADRAALDRLDRIASLPGGVLFMRANDTFQRVLAGTASPVRVHRPDTAATPPLGLPKLHMPKHRELATVFGTITDHEAHQLGRVHDRIAGAYRTYLDLASLARTLIERRAEAMIAAANEPNAAKRRKQLAAATSEFLADAERALADLVSDHVPTKSTLLGEALAQAVAPGAALPEGMAPMVTIERPRADFKARLDDSLVLRAWKRRIRWRYFYRRMIPQRIAIGALVTREYEHIVGEEVERLLERFRAASHDLAVEIGRLLATSEWRAHVQLARTTLDDPAALVARITETRDDALRRLDGISTHTEERIAEQRAALDVAISEATRRVSEVLDRVDAPVAAREAQRARRDHGALGKLPGRAETWRDEQLGLLERAQLAVRLAKFRDRLTLASTRALDELVASAASSGARACTELREAIAKRMTEGESVRVPELREEAAYDQPQLVAQFSQAASALSGELPEQLTMLTDDAATALVRGDAADEQTTVPVRAAVQAIVEVELIARLATAAQQVAEADARAWSVARETLMLVSARPRESEDDDADEQSESFSDAVARLDAQLEHLREVETSCVQGVLDGLQAVASAAAVDALATTLAERGGKRAAPVQRRSRVRELAQRAASGLRNIAAHVVYRRSAGIVYAHESRAARRKTAEQTLRELTAKSSIDAVVASSLPIYYRNLFTGLVNINESFFVGRDDSVRRGAAVIAGERPGLRSVLVTGHRGSGKTTLCQQIALAAKGDVHWIAAPSGGACTAEAFRAAMESSLGMRGTPISIAARLPKGSVLVLDDLDLWWERRPAGLSAIDAILDLIGETGDRVGFVLAGTGPAVRMIQDLRPLSRYVYAQLDCQPLPARALEKVIMARHSSTGFGLRLGNRESLGSWTRARLFDAHFEYSKGNVGYALRSWVTHIEACSEHKLTIRMPTPLDWDAIDDLGPEHVALLVELVLHKAATVDKLQRLADRPARAVADSLADLVSIGLVVQNRRKVAQLNPFVSVPVIDWLERRGLA